MSLALIRTSSMFSDKISSSAVQVLVLVGGRQVYFGSAWEASTILSRYLAAIVYPRDRVLLSFFLVSDAPVLRLHEAEKQVCGIGLSNFPGYVSVQVVPAVMLQELGRRVRERHLFRRRKGSRSSGSWCVRITAVRA